MPTSDQFGYRGVWFRRRIRACRVLLGGLRRWGLLAWEELLDDSQSASNADRTGGGRAREPVRKQRRL